jgi:NADH-quinone oxidoreductase subunit G
MAKMVNLSIDGIPVTVPEGTLVVDAAKLAGIDIPVFCYHPKMEPVGMCRMCLVEIGRPMIDRATGQPVLDENGSPKLQFMPKPETGCTNPVVEGMVVKTQSEKAVGGQKTIIELLLTSHPLDCPVCDKGGECPLQNLTMQHGADVSRFLYDEKHHAAKKAPLGELIWLDRERCIQCGRCVRFQDEIVGEPVLGFYQRGRDMDIVTFSEPGFDSIFSGNTTDICPVGALTTEDFRFGARPWELNSAASVCTQCPVGCNTTLNVRREAKAGGGYVVKRVMPRQNEQVNEIWICDKGRFAGYQYAETGERLTQPMLKSGPAELETALQLAADKLAEAKSDAIILAGGRLSNEDLFNLKSLADVLGGKAIFYTPIGGGEYTTAYGLTEGSNLGDLARDDTILVVASDIHDEGPVWYLRLKAAAKRGATLIVANARSTKLEEHATFAVRYPYGEEVGTVKGLLEKEGIGPALKDARNLVIFYGSDGLSADGSAALAAACAELVKDRAGKPNNGLVGVWNAPNAQGAWELGFRPASDLASELAGKTVYIAAADPAGDDPALAEALKSANFIIAQDILPTDTVKLADVVLPAQAFTEREGTYTTGERRVQRFNPAVPARPGTTADYALTARIASRLNIDLEGRSPLLVMNHIAASQKAFAGITYARLAEVVEQHPIVGRSDLYYGGTTYENSQGLGAHLALATSAVPPSPSGTRAREGRGDGGESMLRAKDGELLAVPVTKVYDWGTTMRAEQLLWKRTGPPSVVLSPATAAKFELSDGDPATVTLNGAEAEVFARLDESIPAGIMLVYRSFKVPIWGPVAATIAAAEKA